MFDETESEQVCIWVEWRQHVELLALPLIDSEWMFQLPKLSNSAAESFLRND